jgi:ATP-binding cassette subfamily B protein
MKEKIRHSKLLIKELYEFKPTIFLMITINMLVRASLPILKLLLSAQVIDWLLNEVSVEYYLTRLLLFILVVGAAQIAQRFLGIYFEENTEHFRIGMMHKIKRKYLMLDYPLLVGKEARERYNNANELTDNHTTLFGRLLDEINDLGSAVLGTLLYIGILRQLESLFILLVGIFILVIIVFNVLQIRMDRRLFKAKAANSQKLRYLRKVYGESRLTKDVRLFKMKKWFEDLEEETIKAYYNIVRPKVKLSWAESAVMNIGIIALSALSYIRSVQLITAGAIPVSSFVVFAGAVTILAQTLITLVNSMGKMNSSLNETKRYEDFIFQTAVFNHDEGSHVHSNGVKIELKDVSYTYPNNNKPTIDHVSLVIQPFEKLAIVGENGAGKSTLINLITGLIKPDSGEILINGILQSKFNITEYYELFAPVFQEKFLLTYSIRETIIQGSAFDEKKYARVLELSGMKEIIQVFEKGDETKIVRAVDPDGVNLSGGQLQKLKLAQSLYKDAPVLILDEPTSALDPIAEHQVYKDYFHFSKNKLSIFISHRLSSTRFCDRIIYIKNGKITESGTHDELIVNQKDYYNLYEAQAYYYRNEKDEQEYKEQEPVTGGVI